MCKAKVLAIIVTYNPEIIRLTGNGANLLI